MAVLYKYSRYIHTSHDAAFDQLYAAGTIAPISGIYRCEACGKQEIGIRDFSLPAQSHHPHSYLQGPIRWRLVACPS